MFLFTPAALADVLDAALSALPALGTANVADWHPDATGDVVAVLALAFGWLLAEVWFVHVTGGVSNGFGYTDIVARNPTLRRVNRVLNVVVPLGAFAVFWVITYVLTYDIMNMPISVLATESVAGVSAKTPFFVIWSPFVLVYSVLAIRDVYMSAKGAWGDTRKQSAPPLVQVKVLNGRLAYPTPPVAHKAPAAASPAAGTPASKPRADAPSKPRLESPSKPEAAVK